MDLNNFKDSKPQMLSLLVFNRVYRLEIQSVMLVFSSGVVYYTCILFTRRQSVRGGGWSMGSQEGRGPHKIKHLPQSPFTGQFLYNNIWHCVLLV
jgi:hypothetical protein